MFDVPSNLYTKVEDETGTGAGDPAMTAWIAASTSEALKLQHLVGIGRRLVCIKIQLIRRGVEIARRIDGDTSAVSADGASNRPRLCAVKETKRMLFPHQTATASADQPALQRGRG